MLKTLIYAFTGSMCVVSGCGMKAELTRAMQEILTTAMEDPRSRTQLMVQLSGQDDIWVALPSESPGIVEFALAMSRDGKTNWFTERATATCAELRDDLRQDQARPWLTIRVNDAGVGLLERSHEECTVLLTEMERCGPAELHDQLCEALATAGWQVDESRLFARRLALALRD